MTIAREILADFRAVEQNFRELDRGMREQIATWDRGKGELLEVVFDEQDGIIQSHDIGMGRNIRHIHHDYWVNAGAHVQETVAALSQQLRRYVDENFLEEERRINQIIREIEGKAVALRNSPPQEWNEESGSPYGVRKWDMQ